MPRDLLRALAADVERLLAAGSSSAAGDEGLRRRERALRELGREVAVLAKVADAVHRVVEADPAQAAAPLLELVSIVRQVRAGLATAGVEGEITPVESSGPWATDVPARDLYPVVEALTRSGDGRLEVLEDAVRSGKVADLRLVRPLLDGLGDGYGELANLIAAEALPAFGRTLLPALRDDLNLEGKAADTRRLVAICTIDARIGLEDACQADPDLGANLCRKALVEGSPALQVQALKCYARVNPAEAGRAALDLLGRGILPGFRADDDDSEAEDEGTRLRVLSSAIRPEVRAAALAVLGETRGAAALDAMMAAAADSEAVWSVATTFLTTLPRTDAVGRVVRELKAVAAAPDPLLARRLVAALAGLARRGDRYATGAILPLLESPAGELRAAAVRALTALGGVAELEAAASLVDDPQVRIDAAGAAWQLPAARRYERLAPLLCLPAGSGTVGPRQRLLLGLFEQEYHQPSPRADWDPRWADPLRPYLDGPFRAQAARALALVLGPGAVPDLVPVLAASVRVHECGVVEALGRLRAREAVGPLVAEIPALPAHHSCIHDALRQIGDPAAIPLLRDQLAGAKGLARQLPIEQLIAFLEKQAVP